MSGEAEEVAKGHYTTPCAPPETWRRPRRPEMTSHKRCNKIEKKTKRRNYQRVSAHVGMRLMIKNLLRNDDVFFSF
jgi:hypothetical protein